MRKTFLNHVLCLLVVVYLMLGGCATEPSIRIDNIPMYGQPAIERPDFLKKGDEDFIKQAVTAETGLKSREEASKAWHAQGEKFMREGNLDYAMRRYNPYKAPVCQ